MKKMLPIKRYDGLDRTDKYECWTALRLSAALADDRFLPWYLENFISIMLDQHYCTMYHEFGSLASLSLYNEPLVINEIYDKSNILARVMDTLNNNGYINLYYDRYYLKDCDWYRREHYLHDILIYGCDTDKRVIHFFDSEMNPSAADMTMDFDAFEKSFASSLKYLKIKKVEYCWQYILNLPLHEIYLKEPTPGRQINLTKIYEAIDSNLRGGEFVCENYSTENVLFPTSYKSKKCRYGVSIFKGLYDELLNIVKEEGGFRENPNNRFISYGVLKITDNKKDLLYRLNYLNDNGFLKLSSNIAENIACMNHELQTAYDLIIEAAQAYDADAVEKAREKLKAAEKLDIQVLTEAKGLVYKAMQSRRLWY